MLEMERASHAGGIDRLVSVCHDVPAVAVPCVPAIWRPQLSDAGLRARQGQQIEVKHIRVDAECSRADDRP